MASALSPVRFVIDGTNVLLVHGRAQPELRYVLALCRYLETHSEPFVCFFDANTSYLLEEHDHEQFEVFKQIMQHRTRDGSLNVVPSGTEADEWILERAKSDGAHVISNDKYRNRARKHRWIWKRRHPLVGTSDRLIIESLGFEIPVLPAAGDYL